MALYSQDTEKVRLLTEQSPTISIFLRPIAPPAALGLAGLAGSTWIAATWIAGWWGTGSSPNVFFPFVAFWGGLGQFIAGLYGFPARDTLITVMHCLWGSFWMSIGFVYLLTATGALPPHAIHEHFVELATWITVNAAFTWVGAIAALARDLTLFLVLFFLATGSTVAMAGWYQNSEAAIRAAAYFWIFASIAAWWRVTVYLLEEAFGSPDTESSPRFSKFYPVFRMNRERARPLVAPGLGEPGVKRGMPGAV